MSSEEEDDIPVPAPRRRNNKKNKSGFAALAVEEVPEDDDQDEEVSSSSNKFSSLEIEEEASASPSSKKKSGGKGKKATKQQDEVRSSIPDEDNKPSNNSKRGKKTRGQRKATKEPEKNDDSVDPEEEAETRYNRAQEIKGREAPSYVHLRSTAAQRSKTGNDISVDALSMTVPGRELLKEANLTLAYGHRYGLVGRNGIGKSTLMTKIANRDGIVIPAHLRILYVEQEVIGDDNTAVDSVLQADVERVWLLKEEKLLLELEKNNPEWMDDPEEKRTYTLRDIYERLREIESDKALSRASAILVGLGFDAEEVKVKPTKAYSGGWRMRIALARALFCRPELLLLDEPTNHLDLHACFWLEAYLQRWERTLLVVSHEATFLNEVADHIIHFHDKTLTSYVGDYWHFVKMKDQNLRAQVSKKDKQEKKIAQMKDFINKNKTNKNSKQAASRKKQMGKIEVVKVDRDDKSLIVSFPDPDYLPPPLIKFEEVSFGYTPDKIMFKNLDFGVDMDTRVALVGMNGVGKSTLMKMMAGELLAIGGYIERSRKIRVARFTQHHVDQLNVGENAVDYLQTKFGTAQTHDTRQHLGRFGISGNLATNPIDTLSGGQKSRVVLAELAWAQPHILLLDEPSNHLDIDAIEALAVGLNEYKGGIILISHNQRLISRVCNQIWVVTRQGTVEKFNGEFDDYKEQILAQMSLE